jgi:hypothetical protein
MYMNLGVTTTERMVPASHVAQAIVFTSTFLYARSRGNGIFASIGIGLLVGAATMFTRRALGL